MNGKSLVTCLELFSGKRVLVTGDTGFKGSWLCMFLHELGAKILGYALPPLQSADNFNVLELNKLIRHVDGDIRNLEMMSQVFQEFQPEFVFHLAAQPLVRLSYHEPERTFSTNVGGSVNVLEAVRATSSIRSLIYVTSDKCYKNREWLWGYRENDKLGGHDPYSASKAAAEIVFSSYLDSFFRMNSTLGAASVRAGNVIGGGDWSQNRIIPDCIRSLQKQEPILLRNPYSTRPWQHVLEPVFGYLALAVKLYETPQEYSGSWNFGPRIDSIRPVHELAEQVITCWGQGEIKHDIDPNSLHEALLLQLNCDKANQLLGWLPCWNFERTIFETVRWYRAQNSGESVLEMTKQQVQDYRNAQND
ncbi:CDP-glucose 4,6-dehydratase [Acaryochloris sp. IP29b_bin.137]|uniref:CDP-glucose 4,6-dehydratase n=1 Tax=Acaryochloris sp. IP29b_bin.137 TaxID=2969217 RepID=UPI00261C697D|nr:CDP-glucose 4,6-dehydratase [Acaryochloris sp. IP29b_bin.137]